MQQSRYVYDGLGRQTTTPAADAPQTDNSVAGTGAITVGYYADDAARTISRGGVTTTIDRDPAGRRLTLTSTGDPGTEVKHYTDDSDNPSWTIRTQGTTTTTTRYESTIGGDLALTITDAVVELAVNNPHGDTVTTIPLTGNDAGTGIKGWAQFDEYGNQLSNPVSTGATTYAWHGADQRALDTSGLILMGARLYNSVTGLFTSRDPVVGGNTTTYAYPQDPIGSSDTSGQAKWWDDAVKRWKKANRITAYVSGIGATAIGFAPCGYCQGASVAASLKSTQHYLLAGDTAMAGSQFRSTIVGAIPFNGGKASSWRKASSWASNGVQSLVSYFASKSAKKGKRPKRGTSKRVIRPRLAPNRWTGYLQRRSVKKYNFKYIR